MNTYIQNKLDDLVEILAEKEHDRWAHWQKYMHERVYDSSQSINPHLKVIPTEDYNRWERQLNTPYSELSEKEKESDREQVRKYLPIIEQAITDYHNHIVENIYNAPNDKINCLKQHIAGESIWLSKRDILNLLQDTNPKE